LLFPAQSNVCDIKTGYFAKGKRNTKKANIPTLAVKSCSNATAKPCFTFTAWKDVSDSSSKAGQSLDAT